MPAGAVNGTQVNNANPLHPFGMPNFERATYASFADQASALTALEQGNVDGILALNGLPPNRVPSPAPGENITQNVSPSAHFVVLNPSSPGLADPILRRALFCAIDRNSFTSTLGMLPLASFILPGDGVWASPKDAICGEGYDPLTSFNASKAAAILKTAGYTWKREPAGGQAGTGLTQPDGRKVPAMSLLGPSEEFDPQAAQAGMAVEASARYLGIPLTFEPTSPADIRFAVFNTRNYDMAIIGWRLSAYPGYLCDWFGPGNPFGYQDGQIASACTALGSASGLETAQAGFIQIQSLLAQNPAFIPLYSGVTIDVTRRLSYPFDHVLGGLSGLYGAPSLAIPAAP